MSHKDILFGTVQFKLIAPGRQQLPHSIFICNINNYNTHSVMEINMLPLRVITYVVFLGWNVAERGYKRFTHVKDNL